jgi:hypothetical protein
MDELDRYEVYVSQCDHCISQKASSLASEHETDSVINSVGDWCLATEVDTLEETYSETLAEKDSLQEDLDDLQTKYDALLSSVDNLLADANDDNDIRGYYLIDEDYIKDLNTVFDDQT